MKLFYVMGGGLGHLYRVRTFINQFGLTNFKVLTNNPLAEKLFDAAEIIHCDEKEEDELAYQIKSTIENKSWDELYIDTFPAGLFGELRNVNAPKRFYLARRLRWNMYQSLLENASLQFERTFCFEELEAEHEIFVRRHSTAVTQIELRYPEPHPDRIPYRLIPQGKPIWLIVHTFIRDEIESLIKYAQEVASLEKELPVFVALTDQQVANPDVLCHSYFPAMDWFPLADRIFTGGGFNTLKQATAHGTKITAIPFPRRYDDQKWRIEDFKIHSSASLVS